MGLRAQQFCGEIATYWLAERVVPRRHGGSGHSFDRATSAPAKAAAIEDPNQWLRMSLARAKMAAEDI